jgi:hypothetical protein
MKKCLGAVLILGALATGAQADDKPNATGTWKWSITTQGGDTIDFTLKLKQEGDKVTGALTGRMGRETKIENGMVKNGEVSFDVTNERDGQKFTRTYRGKVEGDTIKGKIEFERNGEKRTFDWEAKREKA